MDKVHFQELYKKHQAELSDELLKDIYRRSRMAIFATLSALIIFRIIIDEIFDNNTVLQITFYTLIIITIARLIAAWYGWRAKGIWASVNLRYWSFAAGTLLTGSGLAALNIIAYPTLTLPKVSLLIVFQAGIMSAALVSTGSSRLCYALYVVPNLLSLGILSAVDSREWGSWILLLLIISYSVTLIIMIKQQYKSRSESVLMSLELNEMAFNDGLTKLSNRWFLSAFMDKEVDKILRSRTNDQQILTLMSPENNMFVFMLDIDHFKDVNDTYGHAAGDAVLKQVADILHQAVRKSDIIVRWGGEEFVIVSRDDQPDGAREIAKRIQDNFRQNKFILPSGESIKMTCSIGYAQFPFNPNRPDLLNWEQVLRLADAGVYEAKQAGRDRIMLVSSGINLVQHSTFDVASILNDFPQAIEKGLVQVTAD